MKICNPKIHRQKFLGKGDEMKKYRPISSNIEESSEEPIKLEGFYPFSYYDLSAFEPNEHIQCGDELFNGTIHQDDIEEIFLAMRGAGNPYDNQSFEVQTAYPINLINSMRLINNEKRKIAHRMPDVSFAIEQTYEDYKHITIKTQVQNQEISITCDNLLRLIDKALIRDEESLLQQSEILNSTSQTQHTNTYKKRR